MVEEVFIFRSLQYNRMRMRCYKTLTAYILNDKRNADGIVALLYFDGTFWHLMMKLKIET